VIDNMQLAEGSSESAESLELTLALSTFYKSAQQP
jgi:hypothetical protein